VLAECGAELLRVDWPPPRAILIVAHDQQRTVLVHGDGVLGIARSGVFGGVERYLRRVVSWHSLSS